MCFEVLFLFLDQNVQLNSGLEVLFSMFIYGLVETVLKEWCVSFWCCHSFSTEALVVEG